MVTYKSSSGLSSIKETILSTIYSRFAKWATSEQFCCKAGCFTCCSTNVTITALEGLQILKYCEHENLTQWLGEQLVKCSLRSAPEQTTNEFVATVLNKQTAPSPYKHVEGRCFFLQDEMCLIYPVRPFSCRCFASTTPCSTCDTATVPDTYLYGSTAAMQIIEHLGQFNSWGFMCDILVEQAHLNNYSKIIKATQPSEQIISAKSRLRAAQPIAGFIFPENENNSISALLQSVFSAKIDSRTVEQILNGEKA